MPKQRIPLVAVAAISMQAGCQTQTLNTHRSDWPASAATVMVNSDIAAQIQDNAINANAAVIPLGAGDRIGNALWEEYARRLRTADAAR